MRHRLPSAVLLVLASGCSAARIAAGPSDAGAARDSDVPPVDPGPPLMIRDAGCGQANPASGSLYVGVVGNQTSYIANYIVTLPNGYQPPTPVPLVFGFHGRNRTNEQFEDIDALDIKTEIAPKAIMVYPQSQGGPGWEMSAELPVNIQLFRALWSQMFSTYCVDPQRVFVMGHSSGAIFSNILGCFYGDVLRGVGAVASTQPETTCAGHVAALLVHGGEDPIIPVSKGEAARDFWLQRNGCQTTTTPGEVSPCVAYQGCTAGFPVEWCQHAEPTYTNTDGGGHGYPTFASKAIGDFFFALTPKTTP